MNDIWIHLRRTPGADQDDGRLKKALKALLRRHGLQVIDIRDATEADQTIAGRLNDTTKPTVRAPGGTGRSNRPRRRSPYAN